jgi:hypothetical protein
MALPRQHRYVHYSNDQGLQGESHAHRDNNAAQPASELTVFKGPRFHLDLRQGAEIVPYSEMGERVVTLIPLVDRSRHISLTLGILVAAVEASRSKI